MSLIPLINIILEVVLERLLYQNYSMSTTCEHLCKHLKDKILRFELVECDTPFILIFSEHQIDVLNDWNDTVDCTVRIHFATLLALREYQQLIQIVKQGRLNVYGNLQCLQQFSMLLDMTKVDVAELLAPLIGDIFAESIAQIITNYLSNTLQLVHTNQKLVTQAITDEWQLIVSALEQTCFFNEVNKVSKARAILADRLKKLETSR